MSDTMFDPEIRALADQLKREPDLLPYLVATAAINSRRTRETVDGEIEGMRKRQTATLISVVLLLLGVIVNLAVQLADEANAKASAVTWPF